ncbi:MAG: mucoidy inhibitor MuiA family protein, partial [Beijerinckiaceae bacterium]
MRAPVFSATVSVAALLLALPAASAAELALHSKIDSVTVFPDAAMVTRTGALAIPSGSHTLLLQGLPAEVDPASIRIEGSANAALLIGSVETRAAPADPKAESEAQKKLRDLRASLADTQGQIEAAETQKRAIEKSAGGSSEKEKPMEVAQLRSLWTAVGEATAEVNGRLVGLRQRSADIEADIRALEATLVRGRPGVAPRTDLTVALETEQDTRAELKITYRVRNARWVPTYDARLDTGTAQIKPKLELIRRASIVQRTGEDWADAEVTLSTARVAGNAAAPVIDTLAVNIWEPPVVAMDAARARVATAPAPMAPPPAGAAKMQEESAAMRRVAAQERDAGLLSTDFSAEYKVPGRVTVTRDGAQKTVRLSARDYAPELVAKAVPALESRAYL